MSNILTNIIDSFTSGFENKLGLNQSSKINKNSILYANNILQYTQDRSIQYGDRGKIVSDLEYVLNLLGYKTYSTSSPDGIFGDKVKYAVESIQSKSGIINNGIVSNMTARILYNMLSNDIREASIVPNMVNNYVSSKLYPKAEDRFNKYLTNNNLNVVPGIDNEYQIRLKSKHNYMTYIIGGALLLGGILLFRRHK